MNFKVYKLKEYKLSYTINLILLHVTLGYPVCYLATFIKFLSRLFYQQANKKLPLKELPFRNFLHGVLSNKYLNGLFTSQLPQRLEKRTNSFIRGTLLMLGIEI